MTGGILEEVRRAAPKRLLFLPHAITQMSRPDRRIEAGEVEGVTTTGELVEDYPDDVRGPSCLLLGYGADKRPIHVVCAPRAEYLAVITAYLPDPAQWTVDFKKRA